MSVGRGGDPAQRISQLEERLKANPSDQPLRLELIQAYTAAGRVDDFLREAEVYKSHEKQPAHTQNSVSQVTLIPAAGYFDEPAVEDRKRFGTRDNARGPLAALMRAYEERRKDRLYLAGLDSELERLAQRPTPLILARRLSDNAGGARIYLKHENTGRTDPHLSIAVAGQVHLARTLGRRRVLAGVRDLHWGVRLASACAYFGVEARIFVDEQVHKARGSQAFQMQLMGAQVHPVRASRYPHGDIREAALEAWLENPEEGFLFTGLDSGPDPYPLIARDLTAVIGRELRTQVTAEAGRGPDVVVVRGGENADALGVLPAFLDEPAVRLCCVEPAPSGAPDLRPAPMSFQQPPAMDATRAQAILEGLEYESVARERSLLKATGRVQYVVQEFDGAREALRNVAKLEGVQVGLATAHALAHAIELARGLPKDGIVAVLLAERPDKDLWDVAKLESLGV